MYIIIENSFDDKIVLHYRLNTKWVQREFISDNRGVLLAINELLEFEKKKPADLSGIGIVLGIGRFTGTRIAVTVANTLAYAFSIPVVGLAKIDYPEFERMISEAPVGQYVSAKYSGEANIGKAKNKE